MMVVAVPKHRIASAAKSAPMHSQKAKDPQGAENVRNPARSRSAISVSRSYVAASRSKPGKRRQIVWQIEKYLAEDGGRPISFHPRSATCSYPQVKGITVGVNSPYNLWRMEDAWLDR
jgi:hypothetical protein